MRAVIPIYIESSKILIKSIKELKSFKENSPKEYTKALLSKDIENLYFGYAKDQEKETTKRERIVGLNEKTFQRDFPEIFISKELKINKNNRIELIAQEYQLNQKKILSNSKIIGYHRQKSYIKLNNDIEIDNNSTLSLEYVTLAANKPLFITIKENSKLILNNTILDKITVIVENNAILEINDVKIVATNIGIIQNGNGLIKKEGEIKFESVTHPYKFEELNAYTASNIVDMNNIEELKIFIEHSLITNLLIDKSLDFRRFPSVKFPSNIRFINTNQEKIEVFFNSFTAPKGVFFDINIFVHGKFDCKNNYKNEISLGRFMGRILITESENIKISKTIFLNDQDSPIISEFSKNITVENSVFANNKIILSLIKTKILFKNVEVQEGRLLIDIVKRELSEEELDLYGTEYNNQITIENSKIDNMYKLAETSALETLNLKNTILSNIEYGFNLENCIINMIGGAAEHINKILFLLNNSHLIIENVEKISDSKIAISAEKSAIEIYSSSIVGSKEIGVNIHNSIFYAKNLEFKNNNLALNLEKGRTTFINDGCYFLGNKKNINKGHETIIMTGDEYRSTQTKED